MPRPKNKLELLDQSHNSFNKLMSYIESMAPENREKEFGTDTLNRNIRDVLGHLYHWHMMLLGWYEVGMAGRKPAIPAKGYTWRTVPELNRKIQGIYAREELSKMIELLGKSHQKVSRLIENHSEKELFEKNRYKWTGTTSLGAYLISATTSHYEWGVKLIKKGLKPVLNRSKTL